MNEIYNNYQIKTWDVTVIVGYNQLQRRIPITAQVTTHQAKTIPAGINYLVWTNATPTTLMNISIGLSAGDWIHVYDTETNTWNSRWISYYLVGSDIQIKPYTVFVAATAAPRNIGIGSTTTE